MGSKTLEIENYFKKSNWYKFTYGEFWFICKFTYISMLNKSFSKRLKAGDEVLIPAICWSTSLWPIIQSGLKLSLLISV